MRLLLPSTGHALWTLSTRGHVRAASTLMSDVHGTTHGKKHWRNKPLFRREGDKKFRNGQEAADMLCVHTHFHTHMRPPIAVCLAVLTDDR
ncbi:hypothetical protein PINS_up008776 [Pythium insidiosum]|nr:hypothetical protein PINS_up008776 [Pythium insidiosum]